MQVAQKVVGVGSVGLRAWVILLDAMDGGDPLFLQAKEARLSVLTAYSGRSKHSNQGQRVVTGQHLMQATSDIFLGWTNNLGASERTVTSMFASFGTGSFPFRLSRCARVA